MNKLRLENLSELLHSEIEVEYPCDDCDMKGRCIADFAGCDSIFLYKTKKDLSKNRLKWK